MALLLVPAAGLLGVAGLQLVESLGVVRQTADIEALTQVAEAERDLLHSLQIERTRSLEYIALLAGGVPSGATEPLQQARTAVETARSQLDATLAELDLAAIAPEVLETDSEAQRALAALQPLRFNLDAGRAEGQNVIRSFDDPIEALLQVDQRVIALIDEPAVRDSLQGSLAISQIKDAAIRSGDVVLLAASGAISQSQSTQLLTGAQTDFETWLGVAQTYLPSDEVAQIVAAQEGLPAPDDALSAMLTSEEADEIAVANQAAGMADVTERSAEALRDLETAATQRAVRAATATRDDALRQAIVVAIVAGAVVLVGLLLLVVLLRGVVRPLRQLTSLADRVRTTLPDTVERVASGAQAGESVFEGPFGVALTNRPDELGELARAIRASTDEATRVASEQAATRAGVARTIEDVARREQMLVERQLSLLDQLEDTEEDPDQLAQLFRLDHLATRMRRNAENLLLLASGRLPGGQDATPVPLIDVVRTAAAEIEQYSRVDVRVGVAATVVGYASTPLSHLLAELIENATQFSPPTSRVSVGARLAPEGVVVSIRDRGIAMSEAEIADARRKLAAPPLLEAAESRRLGLYVVGLIAGRIGIAVDLRVADEDDAGGPGGIVVEVSIPAQLFLASGEGPVAAPAEVDPAPAAGSHAARLETAAGAPRLAAVPDFVDPETATAPHAEQASPLASMPRLETPPDALTEMRHLLDAQPSTPPALPADVRPAPVQGLPSRGDSLPRRDTATPGTGLSLSAASGGRVVDLNPQAVGQLMASLSGLDADDAPPEHPAAPARPTVAAPPAAPAAPAAPPSPTAPAQPATPAQPTASGQQPPAPARPAPYDHTAPAPGLAPFAPTPPTPTAPQGPDWSTIDVDAALDSDGAAMHTADQGGSASGPARRRGRTTTPNKKNGIESSWSTPFPPQGA